jgi:hypothetical protein
VECVIEDLFKPKRIKEDQSHSEVDQSTGAQIHNPMGYEFAWC